LHHFDSNLPENVEAVDLKLHRGHPVSRQIAEMAANTCQRSDALLSKVHEAYSGNTKNNSWALLVKVDCSVPSTDDDPAVAYFHANKELNEEGKVEFIPIVPRTTRARARYQSIYQSGDAGIDMNAGATI
jgi:hypothetical protein